MIRLKQRTAADLPPWTWFIDSDDRRCLVIFDVSVNQVPRKRVLVADSYYNSSSLLSAFIVKSILYPHQPQPPVGYASDLQPGTWFLDEDDSLCCVLQDAYFGHCSSRKERVVVIKGNICTIGYPLAAQTIVKRVVDPSELELIV